MFGLIVISFQLILQKIQPNPLFIFTCQRAAFLVQTLKSNASVCSTCQLQMKLKNQIHYIVQHMKRQTIFFQKQFSHTKCSFSNMFQFYHFRIETAEKTPVFTYAAIARF